MVWRIIGIQSCHRVGTGPALSPHDTRETGDDRRTGSAHLRMFSQNVLLRQKPHEGHGLTPAASRQSGLPTAPVGQTFFEAPAQLAVGTSSTKNGIQRRVDANAVFGRCWSEARSRSEGCERITTAWRQLRVQVNSSEVAEVDEPWRGIRSPWKEKTSASSWQRESGVWSPTRSKASRSGFIAR